LLGADRVHARRKGSELRLVRLDDRARDRALHIAERLLTTLQAQSGGTREEVEEAIRDVSATFDGGPTDRRMVDGLWKLLDDEATWDAVAGELEPIEVRRTVFMLATALRRVGEFDRAAVFSRAAEVLESTAASVEAALYADLRGAQRLIAAPEWSAKTLVDRWEGAQAQAVLLRAVRIEVYVACASAGSYRALFHRLKFLRLLHEVHRLSPDEKWPDEKRPNGKTARKGGHRIVIDGPFSLFESVTKYGLKLAMVLPLLESCDAFHLIAEVRWGATRTPLTFKLDGGAAGNADTPPPLTDEVASVLTRFAALDSAWTARPAPEVLELPGVGLCVPDLLFEHKDGTRAYLEVLGFWSRDAVFRRIELVERGLPHPIVFAVSKRLRVREDLIEDGLPGSLYVYKGTMSARVILDRLEHVRTKRG